MKMKTAVASLGIGLQLFLLPGMAAEMPRKKLIEVGWDMPDTAFLRQHWAEMERDAPFDGLNFYVTAAKPDGGRASSLQIRDGLPWQRDWFAGCVSDLQACRFTRFRCHPRHGNLRAAARVHQRAAGRRARGNDARRRL